MSPPRKILLIILSLPPEEASWGNVIPELSAANQGRGGTQKYFKVVLWWFGWQRGPGGMDAQDFHTSPALLTTVDLCRFPPVAGVRLSLYFVIALTPFLSSSCFCFPEAAKRLGGLQWARMEPVQPKDEELFPTIPVSEAARSNLKRFG